MAHRKLTAVSIMSSNGVPLQDISDTVGHKSTYVTETVYRHVIAPAIRGGASVMDTVFGDDSQNESGSAAVPAAEDITQRDQLGEPGRAGAQQP